MFADRLGLPKEKKKNQVASGKLLTNTEKNSVSSLSLIEAWELTKDR